MAQLSISTGQGITQAIAAHFQLSDDDCKKVGLAKWQRVMTLVDQNNTANKKADKASIFSKGNDVNSIGDKSKNHENFVVSEGTIEIDDSYLSEIKSVLELKEAKKAEEAKEAKEVEKAEETSENKVETSDNNVKVSDDNIKKGEEFSNYTKDVDKAQTKLFDDITNGAISTEEQRKVRHDEVANMSFDVTGDEYRTLANKKGKTAEEIQKMKDLYKQGFVNFGKSYTSFIDKKYGNGDGVLTKDEYVKYEMADASKETKEFVNTSDAENVFSHIDVNADNEVSVEEMAAFGSMLDMSIGLGNDKAGGVNGKIKAGDMQSNMANMVKSSDTEDGKAMDGKMKTMYDFLFGKK